MNEKNMHGRIFKKLREERGYKLKDVAGDVISTRTLTRFEADETSLPIATFEKLLKKLWFGFAWLFNILCQEYWNRNYGVCKKNAGVYRIWFFSRDSKWMYERIKKSDIKFAVRLDILNFMQLIEWNGRSELFEENKRIIKEKIESTSKLGWSEIHGLINLINSASSEDYSCEYIDRVIEDCFQNIYDGNYPNSLFNGAYCMLLISSLSFLSRNGYYELVEKQCKETLINFNKLSSL